MGFLNINGVPDTSRDPHPIKLQQLNTLLEQHDFFALIETRTDDLSRIAPYLNGHVVVQKTDASPGIAVLARPHVADSWLLCM